jgi:hypothetical protein
VKGKQENGVGNKLSVTRPQNTGLHEQYKPCRLMCTARLPVIFYHKVGDVRYGDRVVSLFSGEHVLSQAIYMVVFVWCNYN